MSVLDEQFDSKLKVCHVRQILCGYASFVPSEKETVPNNKFGVKLGNNCILNREPSCQRVHKVFGPGRARDVGRVRKKKDKPLWMSSKLGLGVYK